MLKVKMVVVEGACLSVFFHERTYPKIEDQSELAAEGSCYSCSAVPDFLSLEMVLCPLLPVRLWRLSLIQLPLSVNTPFNLPFVFDI